MDRDEIISMAIDQPETLADFVVGLEIESKANFDSAEKWKDAWTSLMDDYSERLAEAVRFKNALEELAATTGFSEIMRLHAERALSFQERGGE